MSRPWCLRVIRRLRRTCRGSWHPTWPKWVGAPVSLRWSRSLFPMMVLTILAEVSLRQIGRQFFGSDLRHFYAAKKFAKFMTSRWKTEWRPNGGHRIPDVAKNCENLYFLARPKMKKVFFELCLSSSWCYKTIFGGNLENQDFQLSWNSKNRPF